MGMPSYMCVFCRHDDDRGQNYKETQPIIEFLNIECTTTKKKSDIVTHTFKSKEGLGKHQLFHLTQRNVHPRSKYDSTAYNRRQTIMLSAEDIGLMGIERTEYQSLKRVRFRFHGACNLPGELSVVFVYNNRGLNIDGAQLSIVRM